ncbi:hypothetical protein HDU67_010365, partial [Dinochytrium kinnereticum]
MIFKDLLLKKAAASSQILPTPSKTNSWISSTSSVIPNSDTLQIDDPWLRVIRTVDNLQTRSAKGAAAGSRSSFIPMAVTGSGRSLMPVGGSGNGELLFLRAPEDVQPIAEMLREMQRDQEARSLFDGLEVPFEVRDTRSGLRDKVNTRPTTNVFGLIESHVISIMILTPSVIIRSSHPRPSNSTTHSIHLLPGVRTTSTSSTLSTSSISTTNSNSSPAITRNPSEGHPHSSSLNRVLASSTLLTSIVESLVSIHSDRILAALDDPSSIRSLEEYGTIAESLGDAISEVMKAVKRVREWDSGVGKWEDARGIYAAIVSLLATFIKCLKRYVAFAVGVLASADGKATDIEVDESGNLKDQARGRSQSMIADSTFTGSKLRTPASSPPPPSVVTMARLDSKDSVDIPSPGTVIDAVSKSADKGREDAKKKKTMGTRFRDRLTAFIEDRSPDSRRNSYSSSLSSDESILNVPATKAPVKKRLSMGDFKTLYAAAVALTPEKGGKKEEEKEKDEEVVFRKSGETPPRLPEIATRQHHGLERPSKDIGTMGRSLSHGEQASSKRRNPQILQMPSQQRLRVVSVIEGKDDWRVRMPSEDGSDGLNSDAEISNPVITGTDVPSKRKKKDRWSQMLIEVTQVSHDAITIGPLPIFPTPPDSPHRIEKDDPENDDSDDQVPLSQLRRALISSAKSPSQKGVDLAQRLSTSPSVTSSAAPPMSRSSSAVHATSVAFSDCESGNGSETDGASSARGSRATFDSLQVVGRKGSQRIPTFDSQGRRIGVLDHGKFSTETIEALQVPPADSDNDADATQTKTAMNSPPVRISKSPSLSASSQQQPAGSISVRGNLLHLNEDGVDVLVMEMVSGRLHIVAGTLEKLLFRLADENIQDMDFVDTLIQCHSFFISSLDLLDNLILRYNVKAPENPTQEEMNYYAKWRRPIQLKVLTVVGRWVKLQYEDFEIAPMLRERLEIFLTDVWMDGFRSESDRIRRVASSQASSIAMKTLSSPFHSHSLYHDEFDADDENDTEDESRGNNNTALARMLRGASPSPSRGASMSSGGSVTGRKRRRGGLETRGRRTALLTTKIPFPPPLAKGKNGTVMTRTGSNPLASLIPSTPSEGFLALDAKDVARYMTVADQNAFTSIPVFDYLSKLGGANLDTGVGEVGVERKLGVRVDLFAERANAIRNWVALEICSTRSLKPRRKVIEKFIQTAHRCQTLNNFHTSLFIVSGLLSAPVQRLKRTWEGISTKDLTCLKSLETYLDPSSNMKTELHQSCMLLLAAWKREAV